MKKKIYKLMLTILITMLFNTNVYAYTSATGGSGTDEEMYGSPCGENDICLSWATYFSLRVTLVDNYKRMVPGTKTVQISPYQPAAGGSPYTFAPYDFKYAKYNNSTELYTASNYLGAQFNKLPAYVDIGNQNSSETILFLGSSRTGNMKPSENDNLEHHIYMGFGKNYVEGTDFGNYNNLREKFLSYATNIALKENYVENYGNVSFVDYILHACGFTESLEAQKDYETLKKLKENHYYLMIEPIYELGTAYSGHWHDVIGTSNQILQFAYANLSGLSKGLRGTYYTFPGDENRTSAVENNWQVLMESGIMKNVLCNFVDGKGLFNADVAGNAITNVCETRIAAYSNAESNDATWANYSAFLNMGKAPYSGLGVISINLNQLYKSVDLPSGLTFDIKTCNDNNFRFSTKVLSGTKEIGLSTDKIDIYKSIYAMDDGDRNKYITTAYSSDGKQLWCYDDVDYSFSNLKRLDGKEYKAGTIIEVPNGELNISRTCYSKAKVEDTTILNNLLVNDNAIKQQYQEGFKLEFNNKNYLFTRSSDVYPVINRNYKEEALKDKTGAIIGYSYTSNITYPYYLREGYFVDKSSINVNNYGLEQSNGTNTIDFTSNSPFIKRIIAPTNGEGDYTNIIDASLNNAFGYSTKTINLLKGSGTKTITYDEDQNRNNTLINIKKSVTLEIEEDNNNSCTFSSKMTNEDVLGEGVQFRVISLHNPFPARDGTSRLAGKNWLNEKNYVKEYILNNRNTKEEEVYNKEPIYKITLDASTMKKIREYNKNRSYTEIDLTCEEGTGRMCISNFLRNGIFNLEGTCKTITPSVITKNNIDVYEFASSDCNNFTGCLSMKADIVKALDRNSDGKVTEDDYLNAEYYTCADKTSLSGGSLQVTK